MRDPIMTRSDFVRACLTYLVCGGRKPQTGGPAAGDEQGDHAREFSYHSVQIRNARALANPPSLDVEGFCLVRSKDRVSDLSSEELIRTVYYPDVERIVREITGAAKVLAFDHNLRFEGGSERTPKDTSAAGRIVHNDYTEQSGPARGREILKKGAEQTLTGLRIVQINLWRPLRGPVRRAPLAVADARSVEEQDLVATDLVYGNRSGEIYYVAFNPNHRWFYFPDMKPDEALLIKGYDSSRDGRARFTPHAAFEDAATPPTAPPRESIEVRTFAVFEGP
jgi:hypothetical protein